MKAPLSPAPDFIPAPSDELSAIEGMILDLGRMRDAERIREIRTAYQIAIDRLHSLVYRLNQPRPRTIGLPAPPGARLSADQQRRPSDPCRSGWSSSRASQDDGDRS